MLEYLTDPLFYRTRLDPSVGECYFSQHDALQLDNGTVVKIDIRGGDVYVSGLQVLSLESAQAIMLLTQHYNGHGVSDYFYLLASDGREWLLHVKNDLSTTVTITFAHRVTSYKSNLYLQTSSKHRSLLVL